MPRTACSAPALTSTSAHCGTPLPPRTCTPERATTPEAHQTVHKRPQVTWTPYNDGLRYVIEYRKDSTENLTFKFAPTPPVIYTLLNVKNVKIQNTVGEDIFLNVKNDGKFDI